MGRSPCYHEMGLKKGPWTPEEDQKLVTYIQNHGTGVWRALPQLAGLNRCGKSCRLRWTNYLRPGIKRGRFSQEEEQTIQNLHAILGNKWSAIASHLPGRTDNEVKNFWNTNLKKKLIRMGYDPLTHLPQVDSDVFSTILLPHLIALFNKEFLDYQQWNHENDKRLQEEAFHLAKLQCLQHFLKKPQAEANANSMNSSITFMNMDTINHLSSPHQFENTNSSSSSAISLVGASNLHFVNDFISSSHMPALETTGFCQEDNSPDPRFLSCSRSTSSPSNVVQPLNDNMVINCNDSTTWPELMLLEDPLFNEISKF